MTVSRWMASCLRAFLPDDDAPASVDARTTVDAAGLAEWTGESLQGIAAFSAAGILHEDASGQFAILASCQAIIGYWRAIIDEADAELDRIEPHGSA